MRRAPRPPGPGPSPPAHNTSPAPHTASHHPILHPTPYKPPSVPTTRFSHPPPSRKNTQDGLCRVRSDRERGQPRELLPCADDLGHSALVVSAAGGRRRGAQGGAVTTREGRRASSGPLGAARARAAPCAPAPAHAGGVCIIRTRPRARSGPRLRAPRARRELNASLTARERTSSLCSLLPYLYPHPPPPAHCPRLSPTQAVCDGAHLAGDAVVHLGGLRPGRQAGLERVPVGDRDLQHRDGHLRLAELHPEQGPLDEHDCVQRGCVAMWQCVGGREGAVAAQRDPRLGLGRVWWGWPLAAQDAEEGPAVVQQCRGCRASPWRKGTSAHALLTRRSR